MGYDSRAHVRYGIHNPGGSDLIGFFESRFCAIEVKTESGRMATEQLDFIQLVRSHGGLAGVARSISDAKDIINGRIKD